MKPKKCIICSKVFKLNKHTQKTCSARCAKKNIQQYNQRPKVKAKAKLYRERPEVKKKARLYHQKYFQRPEIKKRHKQHMKKYFQRPEIKKKTQTIYEKIHPTRKTQREKKSTQAYSRISRKGKTIQSTPKS